MKKVYVFVFLLITALTLVSVDLGAFYQVDAVFFGSYKEIMMTSDTYHLDFEVRDSVPYSTYNDGGLVYYDNSVGVFIGDITYNFTNYFNAMDWPHYILEIDKDMPSKYTITSPVFTKEYHETIILSVRTGVKVYDSKFNLLNDLSQLDFTGGFMVMKEYDYSYHPDFYEGYLIGFEAGEIKGGQDAYWPAYNDGYDHGFLEGDQEGYYDGFMDGQRDYYDGYSHDDNMLITDSVPYQLGFDEGFQANIQVGGTQKGVFMTIISGITGGIAAVGSFELIPGITVGMLVLIPLVFGVIAFIIGGRKK